jgi:hypothetical protein
MSAGVCVLNKESVAIAADSAVTIGDRSAIYNTADKLYSLEKFPVGIVTFGSVDLLGVPISLVLNDLILSVSKLQEELFYLKDYSKLLIDFIEFNKDKFSFGKLEEEQLKSRARKFITNFKTSVETAFENLEDVEKKEDNLPEAIKSSLELLRFEIEIAKNIEGDLDFTQYLSGKYIPTIKTIFDEESEKIIDEIVIKELVVLFILSYNKRTNLDLGLSFAGFGSKQIYPAFVLLRIGEVVNGKVRYYIENEFQVENDTPRAVFPFAQSDVVSTYLDGVDPEFAYDLQFGAVSILKNLIDSLDLAYFHNQQIKILRKLNDDFEEKFRDHLFKTSKNVWGPSYGAITNLPPLDLATFAQGLVDMTTFKRKYSIDKEYGLTVGGPTKVASITKRHGFRLVNGNNFTK